MIPDASPSSATRELQGLLKGFPIPVAEELVRLAVLRHWRDGDVVLRGGTVVPGVAMLISGRLRLAATTLEGEEVLFRWFTPGEFVGVASAIGDHPFLVDAIAVGDCRTAYFERSRFLQTVGANADAAMVIARQLSQSAFDMTGLVIARSETTLMARVYAVLYRLARHNAVVRPNGEVTLAVSQNDLALATGASRARVNIELHKLESAGRIRLGYKHIVMLDMPNPGG